MPEHQMVYLEKTMRGLGFSGEDLHYDNVGFYKGKPVVIDFGDESTFSFSGGYVY
jgi:hypothetical protein